MRIGVMTFWWSEDNYGQLLQCYALQKYLRNRGHDAFVVRAYPVGKESLLLKILRYCRIGTLIEKVRQLALQRKTRRQRMNHPRKFMDFNKRHIRVSPRIYFRYEDLLTHPPQVDAYVVGSDQVWNVNKRNAETPIKLYFLEFAPPGTLKIAYAPSFGKKLLDDETMQMAGSLVHRFDAVSVRERDGVDICRQFGIAAQWVCDPTLLISTDEWVELSQLGQGMKREYALVYMLANPCEFSLKSCVQELKKRYGDLEVVYVTANEGVCACDYDDTSEDRSYPTVETWLRLVREAKLVVSNSFHCCLFSMVFKRDFVFVPLQGDWASSNNRVISLGESVGVDICDYAQWIESGSVSKVQSDVSDSDFVRESKTFLDKALLRRKQ